MKSVSCLIALIILSSCSKNSPNNENCKFLLDLGVNVNINLSLPQYSQLPFAGNSVYIPNAGNAGIIVASTGADFLAWDASDPNHAPNACSALTPTGLEGTCGCEDKNKYSLVTGQSLGSNNLPCSLKNYRVEKNGNNLLIFN
ncbi:hypothetical protein [Flavivirga algicola]|uniref:Ferredoxin subunit of nitrite reductase or a ring-hydroxylating dioxygenase n=1 Tax=Flavivirga algicola TaxID=2729136 RepID=A0ABX1RXS6_9FLAO|nr:hypothetical protein [Flavivirga algicola]NMH86989.1 hypothetical protein [Flavivirga algicola]